MFVQVLVATLLSSVSAHPAVLSSFGYNNRNCEAHPHSGAELQDGSWLMVGDSVCWDGTAHFDRAVFAVVAEANGTERWQRVLGEVGYNYGKYATQLDDGSVLIIGSKSVVDPVALSHGYDYVEARAMWRLSALDGTTLSETVFLSDGSRQSGLRDGFMCATPTQDGSNSVVATGYMGGSSGWDPVKRSYDDDPMFLIDGGVAFVTRLQFPTKNQSAPPTVVFDRSYPLNASYGFRPEQGMRVHESENGVFLISAAAGTEDFNGDWNRHYSAFAVDAVTGGLKWARLYKTNGTASHPYAATLSSPVDPVPGLIIAGLAVDDGVHQPVGRLLKVRTADGEPVWERRFHDRPSDFWNLECYGVDTTHDGGYVVTCGSGPMGSVPDEGDCHERTWTAFLYRTDSDGQQQWRMNVTDSSARCVNDAGEFVVSARNGSFGVLVDSGTLGKAGTGGNFGLVLVAKG